jgi:antitoxin (DNA-binding transcriptional repressor) of toxin-antitoxin stability system
MTQLNLPEATQQLAHLVEAAIAGEEIVIVGSGSARVRLVPVANASGLRHLGVWSGRFDDLDQAFSQEADERVAQLFACP